MSLIGVDPTTHPARRRASESGVNSPLESTQGSAVRRGCHSTTYGELYEELLHDRYSCFDDGPDSVSPEDELEFGTEWEWRCAFPGLDWDG